MGILKDSVEKVHIHQERKRQFVIDRLIELKYTQNQFGEDINTLEYEELKPLLVLAEMRNVDIEKPEHRWFR